MEAGNIKRDARAVADKAREALRKMLTHKNPENIPGGSMSACIAIMEARPDVDDSGALCQWIRQRQGGYSAGIRLPRKSKKKMSKALKRALRGT
jgi:hypothetical protein